MKIESIVMKKITSFIIALLVSLGVSSSPSSAKENLEKEIRKISQETPLILQHVSSLFDEEKGTTAGHWSHFSHSSHSSHSSHLSHYSHRSGY